MMEKRKEFNRYQIEMVDLEHLVPQDHLLRKVEAAVDFNKIYDYVEDLYCQDNGRPSVDPVVLIKMLVIQHLFGIPSLRRTKADIEVNVAYRWFLGYGLQEEIPHFSTISYAFHHRFNVDTVNTIFYWILNEIEEAGYLSTSAVFIDGTHAGISGIVSKTQRNDRKSLCRCKRKTRNALYTLSRFGSSRNVGQAEICVHEFKKAGIMEGKGPSKYQRFL